MIRLLYNEVKFYFKKAGIDLLLGLIDKVMEYLPPFTSPLVQMAESDKVVITHTTADIRIMIKDWAGNSIFLIIY